ncbi:hypothetical protein ACFQMM_12540 [Saliphagus sp. GCM10025308]
MAELPRSKTNVDPSSRTGPRPDGVDNESDVEDNGKRKVAAACRSCSNVYAAQLWPDGTVQPIGRRTGCECGCEEFDVIE